MYYVLCTVCVCYIYRGISGVFFVDGVQVFKSIKYQQAKYTLNTLHSLHFFLNTGKNSQKTPKIAK